MWRWKPCFPYGQTGRHWTHMHALRVRKGNMFPRFSRALKLPPNERNISTQRIATSGWAQHVAHVWPPCCNMLPHAVCCWLKTESPGQTLATFPHNKSQHCLIMLWRRLAKRTQHFNAIYHKNYHNIVGHKMLHTFGHPVAICCDMLDSARGALKR